MKNVYQVKIAEVFFELYLHKPISDITVKEIISYAQCSRGTFYKYYADVFDIIEKTEAYILDYIDKNVDYLYLINHDQSKIEGILNAYKANAKYLYILLEKRLDITFKEQLKKMIKQKLFQRINHDHYFQLHFEFGFAGVLAILNYWYLNGFSTSDQEIIKELQKIAFNGVLADLF